MKKYWKEIVILSLAVYILWPGVARYINVCQATCVTDTVYLERIVERPTVVYSDSVQTIVKRLQVVVRDTQRMVRYDSLLVPVYRDSITHDTVEVAVAVQNYQDTVDVGYGKIIGSHEVAGWLLNSKYRYYNTEPVVVRPPDRDRLITASPVVGLSRVSALVDPDQNYRDVGVSVGAQVMMPKWLVQYQYDIVQRRSEVTVGYRLWGW